MQPSSQYSRLAGPGSRLQMKKNNLARPARRQRVVVSRHQLGLSFIRCYFYRRKHLSPLGFPLVGLCWCWLLWSGAWGSSGHGYSALYFMERHQHLPRQMMKVISPHIHYAHLILQFLAIFTKPNNPREGVKGGGPPHLGEGKGRKTPPLPVRTIDKEWKAGVRILHKH